MEKPAGIVRETYDPRGPWVEREGVRYQRTYFVQIDDDLPWHGTQHDRIADYAAQQMSQMKRHTNELIVIQQPNPVRGKSRR